MMSECTICPSNLQRMHVNETQWQLLAKALSSFLNTGQVLGLHPCLMTFETNVHEKCTKIPENSRFQFNYPFNRNNTHLREPATLAKGTSLCSLIRVDP